MLHTKNNNNNKCQCWNLASGGRGSECPDILSALKPHSTGLLTCLGQVKPESLGFLNWSDRKGLSVHGMQCLSRYIFPTL